MATWNISIRKCRDGRYDLRLKIPGAPGGGHPATRALPPDFSDFVTPQTSSKPNRQWRRDPASVDNDDLLFCAGNLETLKEIGGRLHDCLSHFGPEGEVEDFTNTFLALRAKADQAEGLGLRIDLTEAPELSRVPWEALYIAKKDLFLGIDTRTNIVRHLESDSEGDLPPAVKPPIRMLVAVANLDSGLEAGPEVANIELRLGSLPRDDRHYAIETLERATRAELRARIVKWKPHIIHFIGHGGFHDEQGLIYLHSGKDMAGRDAIDSATLRDLVRKDPPWLVVLNSCLSGAAAKADPFAGAAQNLIRANIPFVVAMQAPISDDAAVQFSQDFYSALAAGETVATAVSSGRNGIRTLEDQGLQAELITPVLYSTGKAELINVRKSWSKLLGRFWEIDPADPSTSGMAGIVQVALAGLGLLVAVLGIVLTIYLSGGGPASQPLPVAAAPEPPAPGVENMSRPGTSVLARASAHLALRGSPRRTAPGEDPALTAALEDQILVEPNLVQQSGSAGPRRSASATRLSGQEVEAWSDGDSPEGIMSFEDGSAATPAGPPSPPTPPAYGDPGRTVERDSAVGTAWSSTSAVRGAVIGFSLARIDVETGSNYDYSAFDRPDDRPSPATGPPVGEQLAAVFAFGSVVPERIDIARYAAILSSPAGQRMSIELVGRSDPGEGPPLDDRIGLARAQGVADRLRDQRIGSGQIAVASAASRWARIDLPAYRPQWERRVDARLELRDANRIRFAHDSDELAPQASPMLDELAAFARENPDFLLQLEGHAERSEPFVFRLDRERAARVRRELLRRGLDESRIRTQVYSVTHPEIVGETGPDADRRVQIVLIPIAEPAPLPISAPPPDPPRRP